MKPRGSAEGTIIGFTELMHNANEDLGDAFGRAKRSSNKDGMIPGDTLGALILMTEWGVLDVGVGFSMKQRDDIWNDKAGHLGLSATFKYQKEGMQDLPRFPVYKGIRRD